MTGRDTTEEGIFYFQDHVHWPEPLSPLFGSYFPSISRRASTKAAASLAMPFLPPRPRIVNHYFYLGFGLPGATSPETQRLLQEHQLAVSQVLTRLPREWEENLFPRLVRDNQRQKAFLAGRPTWEDLIAFLPQMQEMDEFRWFVHFYIIFPLHYATGALAHLYAEIMGREREDEAYRLLLGLENKTWETDCQIFRLARVARENLSVKDAFSGNVAEIWERVREMPEAAEFSRSVIEFLDLYGYRLTFGYDPRHPTWREDPSALIRFVQVHLSVDLADPAEVREKLTEERVRLTQTVIRKIGVDPAKKTAFMNALENALAIFPFKETREFYVHQMSASMCRLFFLALGKALVRRGFLKEPQDIFFLTLEEVLATGASREALIEERKADFAKAMATSPPPFLGDPKPGSLEAIKGSDVFKTFEGSRPDPGPGAKRLAGLAGSPGNAEGPACVVRSPEEMAKVRPGAILVCQTTTPVWTPLFSYIRGLVTDFGGVLCHGAVVAREYGLPAVVGTRYATRYIRDGEIVRVDGTSGIVSF